jgi:hypothetical protein
MTAKEILELQRRRPFPGLRVHVSDGTSYDVTHPEMMAVTKTLVFIALPPVSEGVPERSVYCDPIHITRVEPINGYEKRAPNATA